MSEALEKIAEDTNEQLYGNEGLDAVRTAIIESALKSAYALGKAEQREADAKIVESFDERILSSQYHDPQPGSMHDAVNVNIRMTTVMLPNIADAIRKAGEKDSAGTKGMEK